MVSRKFILSTNIVALLLVGCSAKYQCELTKTGVCASVEDTHEAVVNAGSVTAVQADGGKAKEVKKEGGSYVLMETQPVMPLRQTEKVYRILVREYVDENGYLVSSHYIYVPVRGGWKLGVKKPKPSFSSGKDYDEIIRSYLIQKGKIKPQEEEEVEEDEMDLL